MNIVDTNGIQHIFENHLTLQDDYYLAPDVEEEVEMTQLIHGRQVPDRVLKIAQVRDFNWAAYLGYYNTTLNKYGGRSFYNMTGFGDISIIASLHALTNAHDQRVQGQLFPADDQIVVYTGDTRLTGKIKKEFAGKNVTVRPVTDIS